MLESLELELCRSYATVASPEEDVTIALADKRTLGALILAEGFEERSLGLLRRCRQLGVSADSALLIRYRGGPAVQSPFASEFSASLGDVCKGSISIAETFDDIATWCSMGHDLVTVDISGLTTELIFAALDSSVQSCGVIQVGYSEAEEYRPTQVEWDQLVLDATKSGDEVSTIADRVDEEHWLYSGPHSIGLIAGHEGYDSAGSNALVAYLPFKCARLAALISEIDYAEYRFISGKPRLPANNWRLDALRKINQAIVGDARVMEMDTFGYISALVALSELVCGDKGLLREFDVHLAPLGSKLQKISCWVLSSLVPALTIVSSRATRYFSEASNSGIGGTWLFKLNKPADTVRLNSS